MDRKRTVAAAGGISVVLVAGSSAFALANGIFVAGPVAKAGSLSALQARLVPETKVPETKVRVTEPPGTGPRALVAPRRASVAPIPPAAPTTRPEIVPATTPTSGPVLAPAVVRVAAPVVAHSGPSTVPGHHSDDNEHGEEGERDD